MLPEPICVVGFGVAGLFSTLDKQLKQWNFAEYSLTAVRMYTRSGCRSNVLGLFSCPLHVLCTGSLSGGRYPS